MYGISHSHPSLIRFVTTPSEDPAAPPIGGDDAESLEAGAFERAEQTDLMSSMDVLAMEAVGEHDNGANVADFQLAGAVPRDEPTGEHGRFRSKDVYLRLENRVYGPLTQPELDELLASGDLTGFESASNDLRTWTPLIYHPRMTLRGQIDPDATHNVLHQRSDLPTASRAASGLDLEAFGEDEEAAVEEEPAKTPLAAILIKPMRVSRSAGHVLEERVFANLDEESLEEVIERSGIPEAPPIPMDARRGDPLEDTDELVMFSDTAAPAAEPVHATDRFDALPAPTDDGLDAPLDVLVRSGETADLDALLGDDQPSGDTVAAEQTPSEGIATAAPSPPSRAGFYVAGVVLAATVALLVWLFAR